MPSLAGASSLAVNKKGRSTVPEQESDRLRALLESGKVPNYVKMVIELLMETRAEVKEPTKRNAELLEEVKRLREENTFLKEKLKTQLSEESVRENAKPEDSEHRRSIVLSNLVESSTASSLARNCHDFDCAYKILDFLGVERKPVAVYRMGRPQQNRPRLVKVVLPASRFQADAVRRAPRLRFFPFQRGIYLRPSLTWEERERRRRERLSNRRLSSVGSGGDGSLSPHLQQSPPSQPNASSGIAPHSSVVLRETNELSQEFTS